MGSKRAEGWLKSLSVEGFGLIDRTAVELRPGLNVFTGETGSGKSMVIDALGFAFGDRASPDVVRSGSRSAAVFVEIEPTAAARAWLADGGFEGEEGEAVVVSRDLSAQGRSSARINGKPATTAQLRALGDLLIDVVGQHEHTLLLQPGRHVGLLDDFAGDAARDAVAGVVRLYARARDLRADIEKHRVSEATAARELADARYAAHEISSARLRAGEIEELRERRSLLANATKIASALQAARDALDAGEASATTMLGRATVSLDQVAGLGTSLRDLRDQTKALQGAAQDLALSIAASVDDDASDPAQLDFVEERLALIESLRKKYGSTIEEIVARGERCARDAAALEGRDEQAARLIGELDECERDLRQEAESLTALRRAAAAKLDARVKGELAAQGIRGADFACVVEAKADGIGPGGLDRVEFFASLNPNEPRRPIAKAASGGELSRLLLALKVALAEVDPHPIVVLDEIDAGIGGAAARAVGERIAALAQSMQVLCVTHLAQIAAFADEHVALSKAIAKGRATIEARVLDNRAEMRTEIARMLSGDVRGAEALEHAEALLRELRAR